MPQHHSKKKTKSKCQNEDCSFLDTQEVNANAWTIISLGLKTNYPRNVMTSYIENSPIGLDV